MLRRLEAGLDLVEGSNGAVEPLVVLCGQGSASRGNG